MPPTDNVIVFIDMLGFADLVEQAPEAVYTLSPIFRPLAAATPKTIATQKSPEADLVTRFAGFHSALESRIRSGADSGIIAITFSDSAFIHVPGPPLTTLATARALMRDFIKAGVPVRMGAAAGSFAALRFMSDNTATAHIHSTQFLGTAVVNAYRAEKCGAKGLRILLHKSLKPLLDAEPNKDFWIRLPDPFDDAFAEVNYLFYHSGNPTQKVTARYDLYRNSVNALRKTAPESKRIYYDNTFAALKRMRDKLLK